MRAPKTPGIQANMVNINTIKTEPQPLSITAKGGQIIDNNTLKKLITYVSLQIYANSYILICLNINRNVTILANLVAKKFF